MPKLQFSALLLISLPQGYILLDSDHQSNKQTIKQTPWLSVGKRNIPTEQPPLFDEF
jgi:hypothetical protein